MSKSNIGPRISDKARDFLSENFQSVNSGATYLLESAQNLHRAALREIKGVFTRNELMLCLDVMNGTMLTPGINDELLANAVDGIALDGLDAKWEIERENFIKRLHSLTSFQVAALTIWANGFWYGGGSARPERNIEAYVKQLI